MKFIFTKHAIDKFSVLKRLGWKVSKLEIKRTIQNPRWVGISKHGEKTAMSLIGKNHILRIVFNMGSGIIKVITFHVAKRGRYESTLR